MAPTNSLFVPLSTMEVSGLATFLLLFYETALSSLASMFRMGMSDLNVAAMSVPGLLALIEGRPKCSLTAVKSLPRWLALVSSSPFIGSNDAFFLLNTAGYFFLLPS